MTKVNDVITIDNLPADHPCHGRAFAVLTVTEDGTPEHLLVLSDQHSVEYWRNHPWKVLDAVEQYEINECWRIGAEAARKAQQEAAK